MSSPDLEVAWAAGFYDGEGSAHVQRTKGRTYFRISVAQKSPETLRRWARALGVNDRIYEMTKGCGVHGLRLCNMDEIQRAVDGMWPFLTPEKRGQIVRVHEEVEREMAHRPLRRTKPLVLRHNHQP